MHEAQVDGATINVSIVLPRRKLSPPPPTARRGANIDPRIPMSGPRGGAGPPGRGGGFNAGGGRRRGSPSSRYGPRSDVYRPSSRSPSRSPGAPPSRGGGGGGGRYRSRSNASYSSRSRSRSPGPRRRGGGGGGGSGAGAGAGGGGGGGGEDSKTTMTDDAAAAAVMTATRVEAREATDDDWGRVCFWAWMQNFVKFVVGVQVLLGGVDSPSWGGVLVDQPVDIRVYWRWEWLTQGSRSRCHVAALFYGASEVYSGHAACLGGTIRQV